MRDGVIEGSNDPMGEHELDLLGQRSIAVTDDQERGAKVECLDNARQVLNRPSSRHD
jgi:hypothetical protein